MDSELYHMPGHMIRRLHQRSTRLFHERLKAAGYELTPVQFAALHALLEHPGMDQASLANRIAYDRATIGGVIERLERRGLVERVADGEDRRRRLVRPTRKGKELLAALLPIVQELQEAILDNLEQDERAVVMRLMAKSLAP